MKAVRFLAYLQAGLLAGLSGCASPVYDQGAIATAFSAQQLATDLCDARAREQLIKSMGEFVDCYLRAEKQTADTIKLSKPELYDNYAMRAQLVAWEFDHGTIGIDEFRTRFIQMTGDYYAAVRTASAIQADRDAEQKERVSKFLSGLRQTGNAFAGKSH